MWFIAIYNKFDFWKTVGILSVLGFVNEYNTVFMRLALQNITGTKCDGI